MIGEELQNSGWRQGSIIEQTDLKQLLADTVIDYEENLVALIASQSCDIAHNNLTAEPGIEISIAKQIDSLQGHYTHNKNPRILHTQIMCNTGNFDISKEVFIELLAFKKAVIRKEVFSGLVPDSTRVLEDAQFHSYVAWLAARYSRPALPTTFNNLIGQGDPKGKLRAKAKKANKDLTGIYVQLDPDAEILEHQKYQVNLLGILTAGFEGDRSQAQAVIDEYEKVLSETGMNVKSALLKEDDVSVATMKRFKRFILDDLSYRDDAPLPADR